MFFLQVSDSQTIRAPAQNRPKPADLKVGTSKYHQISSDFGVPRGWWKVLFLRLIFSMSCSESQVNAYHFGAAMKSLEGFSLWSKSLDLLSMLLALHLEANVIIYSSCISACEKSFEWLKAMELLVDLTARSIQVDTVVYSAVISAHAQAESKRNNERNKTDLE